MSFLCRFIIGWAGHDLLAKVIYSFCIIWTTAFICDERPRGPLDSFSRIQIPIFLHTSILTVFLIQRSVYEQVKFQHSSQHPHEWICFFLPFICFSAGKLWRRRTVTQAPQGDGRPCPSQMEQWKPCLVKPCYRWRYSTWSECKSEVSYPLSFFLSQDCMYLPKEHNYSFWVIFCFPASEFSTILNTHLKVSMSGGFVNVVSFKIICLYLCTVYALYENWQSWSKLGKTSINSQNLFIPRSNRDWSASTNIELY